MQIVFHHMQKRLTAQYTHLPKGPLCDIMHLIELVRLSPTEILMFAIYMRHGIRCIVYMVFDRLHSHSLFAFHLSHLQSVSLLLLLLLPNIIAWHCHFSKMILHSMSAPSLFVVCNTDQEYRLKFTMHVEFEPCLWPFQ